MRKRAGALSIAIAALGCMLAPPPAAASCPAPKSVLSWSYPAQGQTDVPTNASLWVSGTVFAPTLDGRVLPLRADGAYDLGKLDPHHMYEVLWAGTLPDGSDKLSLSFTTGAGPAELPARELAPAQPLQLTRNPADVGFAGCELAPVQDCFDTGRPTRVRYEVGAGSVAWVVQRQQCDGTVHNMIWPAACGSPVLITEDGISCAKLMQTDGVHVSMPTATYCSLPVLPPGISLPQSSSCTGPWPPTDALRVEAADGVAAGVQPAAGSSSASGAGSPAAGSSALPPAAGSGAPTAAGRDTSPAAAVSGTTASPASAPVAMPRSPAASSCTVRRLAGDARASGVRWLFALAAYAFARSARARRARAATACVERAVAIHHAKQREWPRPSYAPSPSPTCPSCCGSTRKWSCWTSTPIAGCSSTPGRASWASRC